METSGDLGPVMRLIYLFYPIGCRSAAFRLPGLRVRILFRTWVFFFCVCVVCCLLSGRCLRPADHSCRGFLLYMCVHQILCDLVTSKMRRPCSALGCCVRGGNTHFLFIEQRHRAETEGYIRTGAMLSVYIPHRLHHNGM